MDKSSFFEQYFSRADMNAILIMKDDGTIEEVNEAFTKNYGYATEDLKGKNFDQLFTAADRKTNKPQIELRNVIKTGHANDQGFILNKEGHPVWSAGEVMLAVDDDGKNYLIKDIINLESKKQLAVLLNNTEKFLDRIFHSSQDIPMIILDSGLKVQAVNKAFIEFFELENNPEKNVALSQLDNSFWSSSPLRSDLRQMLISNKPIISRQYIYETHAGEQKNILIDTKIVHQSPGDGRKIYVIVEYIP